MVSAFTLARAHHGGRDARQPLDPPRPGLGLPDGKAQGHDDHPYP